MDEERGKIFRVPVAGWIIWGLWAALNIGAFFILVFFSEDSAAYSLYWSRILGQQIGTSIFPLAFAWILTYPIWFILKRSQKVASWCFTIFVILGILGSLNAKLKRSQESSIELSSSHSSYSHRVWLVTSHNVFMECNYYSKPVVVTMEQQSGIF